MGKYTSGKKKGQEKAIGWEGVLLPKALIESVFYAAERKEVDEAQAIAEETQCRLDEFLDEQEDNRRYPESIRENGALRALYDNCGEDEQQALKLHKIIISARLEGFRNNPVKANKIKRALYLLLHDDAEVE